MNMSVFFHEECIQIGTKAGSKSELLREIAGLAKRSSVLKNVSEDAIYNALTKRENISSTGFEGGIAIPHCRMPDVSEFVVGAVTVFEGIDFKAVDKGKTNLLFFIIAPETDRETHIRILSTISRTLAVPEVKNEILNAGSPNKLREAFVKHIPERSGPGDKDVQCVFHIIVQNEERFGEILRILSSLGASVTVVEGKDIGNYLHRLPLFSSFWNPEDKGFNCLIFGTVKKSLVNELIRSVDLVTGGLDKNPGVLITIQELMIASGALNS